MSALVIIPTYLEAENIADVLGRVREAVPDAHVLVVDDGSPDGTADLAEATAAQLGQIHVLRRTSKSGLGPSYRAGFAWGLERGHTVLLEMDADLSHDPAMLPQLIAAVVDGGADLAPLDLGLGWGAMSDTAVVHQLEFSQMGRFFYWRPRDWTTFPLSPKDTNAHAAQVHAIPADADVERRLRKLRPGHVVTLSGYLVDIRGPHGFAWNTSLRRDDTGDGACEIMWIREVSVE